MSSVLDDLVPNEMVREQFNMRPPRRELHGLRFPVIPKPSWLIQLSGGIATLSGVWMQWGTAVALMAGGAATIVVSMLKEAGMLKESDQA